MFARLRPLFAVTASLTLCLLACAHPVAAQDMSREHAGHEPHNVARLRGNLPHPAGAGPSGLHPPLRSSMAMRRDAVSGYGLHASGPLALPPAMREGQGSLAAAPLNGGALNAEPVRAGSLRADIARYNAERAGHGAMEVPRPSAYSSNIYSN